MHTVNFEALTEAISKSWSAKTSASPGKWNPQTPALGQCAVTACVVQDYLGGEILNCVVILPDGGTGSYYYNVIDDEDLDLTKQQFMAGSSFNEGQPKTKGYASTRDYCLSFDATRQRYYSLKEKVRQALGS